MNSELQPEANLKALEQEVTLTKQEIKDFQKLKPEEQEKQKQERLAKLLELQSKLEQAVADGAKAGNFTEAKRLKEEIEKEVADLEQVIGPELSIEALKLQYRSFLKEFFEEPRAEFSLTLVKPEDQGHFITKDDIDGAIVCEFTLNPDTQNLDFENIPESKIFIPELPHTLIDKTYFEVSRYLVDTYSGTHHIPGLEYLKWLSENPTKTPTVLKDQNLWFYFLSSLVRCSSGDWFVPIMNWDGAPWRRDVRGLSHDWRHNSRVVLIKK